MTTVEAARNRDEGLLARRKAVLDRTGWGSRFVFVQPRNACFWAYLVLVLTGVWTLTGMVTPFVGVFAEAYTAAVLSASAFCLVFLLALRHVDRWERTPATLALAAFVGGGVAAPWVMALPGNGALMSLYGKIFGQAFSTDWQAGLSAPFVEETAKGAIFVLLLGLAPVVIRTVYDGLIVGAYVGLGFQVLEDMFYGQNAAFASFGVNQVDSVMGMFVLRSLTGVASHALYTALFCAGIVYLVGTVAQPRRIGRGIALLLAPVVLHGLWDSMSALTGGNTALNIPLILVLTLLAFAALVGAIRLGANQERHYMQAVLEPEVANGTITQAELEAVAGDRRRRRRNRRAAIKARQPGTSRRREKRVFVAVHDLAQDLAAAGGSDDDAVRHARSEIRRLRGGSAAGPSSTNRSEQ